MTRSQRRKLQDTWLVLGASLLVASVVAVIGPADAGTAASPIETVVVKMVPAAAAAGVAPAALLGGVAARAVRVSTAAGGRYELRVPASQVGGVLARLQSDARVAYAEVPQAVHAAAAADDPCYAAGCTAVDENGGLVPTNQANLNTIGAPAAWAITKGAGQRVAVLDTGVDAANPDLSGAFGGGSKVHSFTDVCVADDPECAEPSSGRNLDGNGHGTHVSGIIAADTNNGTDVAALGWSVAIDMFQVLDANGDGNTADVSTAIYDAVRSGDRVINMSLSNFSCPVAPSDCGPDPDEAAAVEYALLHNVVVVAAAGNDGLDAATYPASYPGVLAVAATDDNRVVQAFSQFGHSANIAAPGLNIVSTWNDGGVHLLSGTSMAAPQVAAAAALMIAHDPRLTGPQIAELLEATARPIAGGHPVNGGVLDVPAALAAEAHPPHLYEGYDLAGADGRVYAFGSMVFGGDLAGHVLNKPVVGISVASNGLGYWMDATDGGVFPFGAVHFYGSTGNVRLNKPVVGMAATPSGHGYWLVASDGGIFQFGDAHFYGSTGNVHLNKPIVGMAATPSGHGYWLVASDGGIFEFGDARFYGSTGNVPLNRPVVGMAPTPGGGGYWLVASDGGIFDFGNAHFYGSTGSVHLNKPIVAMTPAPVGNGYTLVATDGGVFDFGPGAEFWGSAAAAPIPAPIVGAGS